MVLAYGLGGVIKVPAGAVSGQGAPPSSFKGDLGQQYFDKSTSPPTEYIYNGSTWQKGGNADATTTVAGIVKINTDGTLAGADDTTVPTSLAVKTYADSLAIAGAPVATEAVQGIGELATDAEAVAGTPSTALKALFLTPSNLAAVFAAPSAIGGTTPAAGSFTTLGATGAVDFDAGGSWESGGANDIDIGADANTDAINIGTGAAARTITVGNSTGATALDVDAGTGGITVDSGDAISIDAAAASNFTTSAGDLSLISSAGSVNITAAENAPDAIVMNASAGGIDITAAGGAAEDIDITNTAGSVNITAGEGVANAIRMNASNGGIDVDAAGAINIGSSNNGASAIVLDASAGGVDILASGAAAGEDINITATGSSVNVSSTEDAALAVYLSANGGSSETIRLRSFQGTGAGAIDLLASAGGITLTGALASGDAINLNASDAAGGIDIDAGTGGVIVDTTGAISLDSAAASNFTVTGAFDLTLDSSAGSVNIDGGEAVADAISIQASDAAGGIDCDSGTGGTAIDSTGAISIDAAAASNFTVTGAFDLTLDSSAGSVNIDGGEAAVDAISIQASDAAGGIDCDSGTGGTALDSTGAISIDAAAASNFTVTGAFDLTLDSSAGSVNIDGGEAVADAISIQASDAAGGIDCDSGTGGTALDSTGAISIDSAAASNFTVTGAFDLTLDSTAGSVIVDGGEAVADAVQITASNAAGGITLSAGTSGIISDTGRTINVTAKTNADTPYAVLGTDHYLTGDTSAGVLTFTLPAAPATGRELYVYDIGGNAAANNITVDGNGNNIAMSGSTAGTKALAAAYSSVHLVYNGTIWMGRYSA